MRQLYLLLTILACFFLPSVYAQDVADFNFETGTDNTASFVNTSVINTDGEHKALWLFGDGTQQVTQALANTQHKYTTGGEYKVCLKLYRHTATHDSVVTADVCKTIRIGTVTDVSCKANFENGPVAGSDRTQVFVAQPWHSSNKRPEQICWNFGDNTDTCINYSAASPHNYAVYHHYKERGGYKVCVTIKYQGGCNAHYCKEIEVAATGTCKTEYLTETPNDRPMIKYFIAQPWHSQEKKPLKICWRYGDGSDTCIQYTDGADQHYVVKHVYNHGGRYEVCLAVLFEGGCEAHYCKVETIEEPEPHPDTCFLHVNEVAVTASHAERKFYVGITPGKVPLKICWKFGDGMDTCINFSQPLKETELMIEHLYPAPGRYELCAKVWYDGGCVAYKCRVVEVDAGNTNICGGYITDSLVEARTFAFKGYSIHNADDRVTSWQWWFGDGATATTQQARHYYSNAGTYEVCLAIKTQQGCETKICKDITVHSTTERPLVLSPNPVVHVLHAVFQSDKQQEVTIFIYNANGLLVRSYKKNVAAGNNAWDFDVSSLSPGIYSFIVQWGNQLANAIFIKQ